MVMVLVMVRVLGATIRSVGPWKVMLPVSWQAIGL